MSLGLAWKGEHWVMINECWARQSDVGRSSHVTDGCDKGADRARCRKGKAAEACQYFVLTTHTRLHTEILFQENV